MKDAQNKREQEKQLVFEMIKLYCNKNHKTENALCCDCLELYEYAKKRIDNCPFMETKTFCSNCKVHCYKPKMREDIREVMRFAGPRMLFYHPIIAISHLIETKKEKNRQEKQA